MSVNAIAPLFYLAVVAVLMAAVVVGLHFLWRHRWDAETARLKAKGLPWIVLIILTVPFIFWAVSLAGAQLSNRAGSAGVLIMLLIGNYSRRVGAAKRLQR